MPTNPNRMTQGGDVEGTTPTDVTMGKPIEVSKASFDPGYPIDNTLSDAGTKINRADLTQGYCSYGKSVGESGKGY